jgi:hypothetical protein
MHPSAAQIQAQPIPAPVRTTLTFGDTTVVLWDTANSEAARQDLRRSMALMGTLGCDLEFSRGRVRGALRLLRTAQAKARGPRTSRFDLKPSTARAMVRQEVAGLRAVNARVEAA